MKSLSEYIIERGATPKENPDDTVWVIKDTDLDGAIFDVCTTEEDAKIVKGERLKENPDAHIEISSCKRSEVEKK